MKEIHREMLRTTVGMLNAGFAIAVGTATLATLAALVTYGGIKEILAEKKQRATIPPAQKPKSKKT